MAGYEGTSIDMKKFDVLSYPKLFHNLKAAIKEVCTEDTGRDIYYEDAAVPGKEMLEIIREKDFGRLPGIMSLWRRKLTILCFTPVTGSSAIL